VRNLNVLKLEKGSQLLNQKQESLRRPRSVYIRVSCEKQKEEKIAEGRVRQQTATLPQNMGQGQL
jgi:hypothetical protein